ncbi:MAG: RNA-binding protein [Magnetococcales bacterium]|nr:RNA-binding protein [Magnetococcales bacterium]MBF0322261.1 RNA-binding protein [Magnetococcales bacterium]
MGQGTPPARVRIDKWLWTARFFKTRTLAAEAVAGGLVHLNDMRTKAGHEIKVGDILTIHRGSDEYIVAVRQLAIQRRPAPEAAMLYEESPESRQARETLAEQRRVQSSLQPIPGGRPTKKIRRHLNRMQKDW